MDEEVKLDKRTKEYRDKVESPIEEVKSEPIAGVYIKDAYSKVENNPGFRRCMHCWSELEPNEDGSPKFRRWPTPCPRCVTRKLNDRVGEAVSEKLAREGL